MLHDEAHMNRQEKLQLHNDLKHYLRLEGDQVEFMAEHLPHAPQGQKRYIDYFVEKQDSLSPSPLRICPEDS